MIDHSCACFLSMTAPGQGSEPLGGAVRPGEKAYDISPMISKKKRKKPSFSYELFLLSVNRECPSVYTYRCLHENVHSLPALQGENLNCTAPKSEGYQLVALSTSTSSFPLITESQFHLE